MCHEGHVHAAGKAWTVVFGVVVEFFSWWFANMAFDCGCPPSPASSVNLSANPLVVRMVKLEGTYDDLMAAKGEMGGGGEGDDPAER